MNLQPTDPNKLIIKLLILTFVFRSTPIWSQTPLFAEDEPLEMVIVMDIKGTKGDTGEDREYHPASITHITNDGDSIRFSGKVKTRGFMRREFCSFPPLRLNFKKKETKNTVFEGQNKLKLVTHCRESKSFRQNLFKEYLIYKHYNLLSEKSFKVRLVHVKYVDIMAKKDPILEYGFLIEDVDDLADRNGMEEIEPVLTHQDKCNRATLDLMALFQYMIGNTDWSVTSKPHNIKFIGDSTKQIHPIPYDFDYAGVVDASYATPDERLQLASVKTRMFRGLCRLKGDYEKRLEVFEAKREDIENLYQNFSLLDEKSAKIILKYFDDFYDTISDSKDVERLIYGACPLRHKHMHKLDISGSN